MRGVYIIVEGQTEEEFVNSLLKPYFYDNGIYDTRAILLETSQGHKGGDLKFARYEKNIVDLLKNQKDILVTSLIDFYCLKSDFPNYNEAKEITDKPKRVKFLEDSIAEKITNPRFIPYIQLHEFEGLLFSDIKAFDSIPNINFNNREKLTEIINTYPNPELLNDGKETAPSKRLTKLITGYKKILYRNFPLKFLKKTTPILFYRNELHIIYKLIFSYTP